MDTTNTTDNGTTEDSRIMTDRDLETLGLQYVAYVRPITVRGETAYSIHAADGTEIAVLGDREMAFATIRQHDMEVAPVH